MRAVPRRRRHDDDLASDPEGVVPRGLLLVAGGAVAAKPAADLDPWHGRRGSARDDAVT